MKVLLRCSYLVLLLGPGSKIKATFGVTFVAVAAVLLLIGGIACCHCNGNRRGDARFADELELANHQAIFVPGDAF